MQRKPVHSSCVLRHDWKELKPDPIEIFQRRRPAKGGRVVFIQLMLYRYFQNRHSRNKDIVRIFRECRLYAFWQQIQLRDGPYRNMGVEKQLQSSSP